MANKKVTVEQEGYEITVLGRNVVLTDALKNYVVDKISKVDRITDRIIEAHVTLDIQKLDHSVDVRIRVGHTRIKVHAVDPEMYAAIDKAHDKLLAKLRKFKSKLLDHHAAARHVVDMNVNVFHPTDPTAEVNDDIEAENVRKAEQAMLPHHIVAREVRPLKTLTMSEAEMKMELSGDNFMIYRSEEDQKLKVIYRRADQNFGIIEPE